MAYEISFAKQVSISDPDIYINGCCWGGDIIRDRLLPAVSRNFEDVMTAQEDWGWFIWVRRGPIRFGIDIFCDDPEKGLFRILLTARRKKLLLFDSYVDSPELDDLRNLVTSHLADWAGTAAVKKVRIPY